MKPQLNVYDICMLQTLLWEHMELSAKCIGYKAERKENADLDMNNYANLQTLWNKLEQMKWIVPVKEW